MFDSFVHKHLILFGLSVLFTLSVKAEMPDRPVIPTPVEALIGNNGYAFQTIIDKDFSHGSRFNFFSVTSFSADYKNTITQRDFVNNTAVGFELFDQIDLAVGISVNTKSGSNFNVGFEYNYDGKNLVFVLSPNIDLSVNHNLDVVGVLEYNPKLKKNWGIYFKVLSLYDYNTREKSHDRSYLYLRLGPSYKNVSFGIGANFDRYGVKEEYQSSKKNNYGLFIRYTFN